MNVFCKTFNKTIVIAALLVSVYSAIAMERIPERHRQRDLIADPQTLDGMTSQ